MAAVAEQIAAIRQRAALSRTSRDALLRVEGEGAYDVLDRLLPCDMFIRNRQARQTVLLDGDGRITADLTLLADGDDYLILGEGITTEALAALISAETEPGEEVALRPLDDHAVIDIDGPYAWQILTDLAGDGAVSLRYLAWFPLQPEITCLRAGQTGEFGYAFVLPRSAEPAFLERLWSLGAALDMVEASAEALRHCRLEAWFFDIAQHPGACPLEWGLQWRLRRDKDFRGSAAVEARRQTARRAVAFRSAEPMQVGAVVTAEGEPIGEVVACSALTGEAIGAALVAPGYAHVGFAYSAAGTPIQTVSPPLVRYLSIGILSKKQRYQRP